MASLTESSLISQLMNNSNNNNNNNSNNRKPQNNKWYDRVYLCWEDTDSKEPTSHSPIIEFYCSRYNSFESADYAWRKYREYNNSFVQAKREVRHTMIPMCKWIPENFDKYILDWKLRNLYWLNKNSFK